MILHPIPAQFPIQFPNVLGTYRLNIQRVYRQNSVPNSVPSSQVVKPGSGLPFAPLLSSQSEVPNCETKIKTWELRFVPLLSRLLSNCSVPKKTYIYNIYISEPLREFIQYILSIIFRAREAEKKYQSTNQENFFTAATSKKYSAAGRNYQHETTASAKGLEIENKFLCSCTFRDSAAHAETNQGSSGDLSSPAAIKSFHRCRFKHPASAAVSILESVARFLAKSSNSQGCSHSGLPLSGSVTRIPSVSRNSVAVALWHSLTSDGFVSIKRDHEGIFTNQTR